MSEIWKPITGYDGRYEVSSAGQVRSLERVVPLGNQSRTVEKKILRLEKHYRGYLRVSLSKNATTQHFFVHRLVADAFLRNEKDLPIVNHKDRNKRNNDISNLEWVSASENVRHWIEDDRIREEEKKSKSTRITISKVTIEGPDKEMLDDIMSKMA